MAVVLTTAVCSVHRSLDGFADEFNNGLMQVWCIG